MIEKGDDGKSTKVKLGTSVVPVWMLPGAAVCLTLDEHFGVT